MQGIQFQKVQTVVRVPIYPHELNSMVEGVYRYLNTFIGEYLKVIKGLVICYTENVGIANDVASIVGVDPKVYVRVSVEFVVMKVVVGGEATGYLTNKEEGQVEIKTHGIITAKLQSTVYHPPGVYRYTVKDVNLYPLFIRGVNMHM
ncbi:hypothetical protein NEMIN01_1266 [Nematocida minor]|uniref:uncharacterized protein n=1 Tax=Nematocida minor TaxID=1912983 RepID=UPI00221F11C2|nr:uncharacterized protein NEMIN01_1266 [Nematocida minor]KAI5190864.1 hypothetical protein NEMIN01_1266 [Nematocida minor]